MTVKKLLLSLTLGVSIITSPLLADDAKARGIMTKVDAREDGKTLERDMKMVLVDKKGHKRVRNMKSYSKDYGKDEKKVMFFKSPADVKNTGFCEEVPFDLTFDSPASRLVISNNWTHLVAVDNLCAQPVPVPGEIVFG